MSVSGFTGTGALEEATELRFLSLATSLGDSVSTRAECSHLPNEPDGELVTSRSGTDGASLPSMPRSREHDREILRLAVPAFLALVAEPLFLLADSAIVGHLGTPQLAGQGIAAVVLQTAVGLCIFLAYGTTAGVARRIGAGDARGALAQGIDGIWLAVIIGVFGTLVGVLLTEPLVAAFGADG